MKRVFIQFYQHFILRTLLFWMLLFAAMRLLFIVVNYSRISGDLLHKLTALPVGLRLDLTMAAYLTSPVVLLWLIYIFFSRTWLLKTMHLLTKTLVVPVLFICLMNIGNYANWGTVINRRVLLYFQNPAEVSHFMSTWQLILAPVFIIGLCWLTIWLYKHFMHHSSIIPSSSAKRKLSFLLIPLFFLFIRGGLQTTPITESAAYYSQNNSNNHAAVNPVFYFMHSVSEYFYIGNKYHFFEDEAKAKALLEEMMADIPTDSTIVLTHAKKPNLIIILLESWTADIIEPLGGNKGVTPFTSHELVKESFLFTQCYGSGYRTDQGLVSVLAGYPAQPDNSIIAYPSKTESLPSFCKMLEQKGYNSSFFYGGDIGFANMKSFLLQQGVDYISDKNNYTKKDRNSKWGAHDEKVLQSQISYLDRSKEPFFSGLLTLSTHEPFEVPMKHVFPHEGDRNKFHNSAYYTDVCLKKYFNVIRKKPWYKNTLIVLVADHGHYLPGKRSMDKPESKRITCLLTGGALTQHLKGKQWTHVMAQHDLISMLAPYYGIDKKDYPFTHDPFTAKHPFAYYANEDVLGFVTDSSKFWLSLAIDDPSVKGLLIDYAKAYLQASYSDFVRR